jgi:hypothetical protein
MQTQSRIGKYVALFFIVALAGVGLRVFVGLLGPRIGNTFSTINSCLDLPCELANATVTAQQIGDSPLRKQLQVVDQALAQSIESSIAYNAPQAMKVDETVTIELLLNPSVEPSALATQITQAGQVTTASIQVTPRMKAVLIPVPEGSFVIQSLHENPEQFISSTVTTKWSWNVTAKEAGTNTLTLVIYRLLTVDGTEDWRLVESYRSDIHVEVTFVQRLLSLDWKWILGIIVTAVLIPGFWRWVDQRKKQIEQTPKPKRQKKKVQ